MPLKKTAERVEQFLSQPGRLFFFFDEGRFGLKPTLGRCWARTGARPRSLVKPGYQNFYLYSSVSPCTGESFTLFLPWVNTEIMTLYLEQLSSTYADKEVMLIMDQAGWHCATHLMVPDNIIIELLPPYSPELNPTEKLWQWLRRHVCRNRMFESEEELMNVLADSLAQLPKRQLSTLCHCSYLPDDN